MDLEWNKNAIKNIPTDPGVYKFLDSTKKVIYIGKAKNLQNRLKQYLEPIDSKTRRLVQEAKYVQLTLCPSEVDALLLESKYIKKYKPKFNIQLKDDKNYIFVFITRIKLKQGYLYQVRTGHKTIKNTVYTFGPYTQAYELYKTLRLLRRIFPFANCSVSKFRVYNALNRTCLYGSIGVCPAPCVKSDQLKVNNKNVRKIIKFFKVGQKRFVSQLERQMKLYAQNEQYEKAAVVRDTIFAVNNLVRYSIFRESMPVGGKLYHQRIKEICEMLDLPVKKSLRIECYDISNLQGTNATGSMVVSIDGKIDKTEYRRFKVRFNAKISDYDMMAEVIERRVHNKWDMPDIMLIDGGVGHIKRVINVLNKLKMSDIKVVGIYKPRDDLGFYDKFGKLKRISGMHYNIGHLHLVELRDEAHRFAKKYHKWLRNVNYIKDLRNE